MKVRLVRGCLWLIGFGCLFLPLLDDPPLHSGAYVQDVTRDGAVTAMVTADSRSLRAIVLGRQGEHIGIVPPVSIGRRHEFRATDLQPGQAYTYEVKDGDRQVQSGSFLTPPADDSAPVRFAAVGDSGGLPWWVWLQRSPLFHLPAKWDWLPPQSMVSSVGAGIAAAQPQFVIHLGDIVYPWGRSAHYTAGFFRPFAEVLRHAPIYAALGNHDVMDDHGRQALASFSLPRNGTSDERCYSFAWGSVRVVVMDFNIDVSAHIERDHPSIECLRRELASCTEPWLIVASHFPIRSESRQGNRADLMLEVLPLLRDHGVDLYLSGHDHNYQRFIGNDEVALVVSGGGGKSLYEFTPRGGEVVPAAKSSNYHWCQIDAVGTRLRLEARSVDGRLLDAFEVVHDKGWEQGVRVLNPKRAQRISETRR